MPVKIRKSGKKFKVVDASGKVFGTHSSREKAMAQLRAINMQLKRKGKI